MSESDWKTFLGASLSLLVVYAASASPIPLYGLYRAEDGLSYSDLSLSAVIYFVGAVTALLVFSRVSSHLGRRPMSRMALLLGALGDVLLMTVHAPSLTAGRCTASSASMLLLWRRIVSKRKRNSSVIRTRPYSLLLAASRRFGAKAVNHNQTLFGLL